MFEMMIFFLVNAMWIGLILFTLVLLILRILMLMESSLHVKTKLLILIMPLSIGIYQKNDFNQTMLKWYKHIHLLSIIMLMIGSILLFYMHLELTII